MFSDHEFFKTREVLECNEAESLAFYALKSSRAQRLIDMPSEGRVFDYRTEYQRDRDRIIYSRAFRRLRNKVKTIRNTDKDHSRDMLSHTIEVSQIARTIGRGLRLNEDLIEAISLGHELGIPPFGEAGEKALDSLLKGKLLGGAGIWKADQSGFRKNMQALRVVDLLEKRYEHEGLNLTNDTREGIVKQGEWSERIKYPNLKSDGLQLFLAPSFESQAVSIADDIATQMESLDDGLRSGEFDLDEVEQLLIVKELIKKLGMRYSTLKNSFMRVASLNRGLTHLFVTNIIFHSSLSLRKWLEKNTVDSTEKCYEMRDTIRGNEIALPSKVERLFGEMRGFISTRLAHSSYSQRARERAKKIIGELFKAYHSNPLIVEDYLLLRHRELRGLKFLRDIPADKIGREIVKNYKKDSSFIRSLCDHIAGMTDSYAMKEFERLKLVEVV